MFATGVGSLPGINSLESARMVAGELPDFIHLVELPQRGPGADMVGRTVGLIAHVVGELGLQTTPQGWRIDQPGGRLMRRAWSWFAEDLDSLEATTTGYAGALKIQVCGPWTLAAAIESRLGERLVADQGATRDLSEALAAAVAWLCSEIRRRVSHAHAMFVQVDEPSLGAVASGTLGTASGLSTYAPVADSLLVAGLTPVMLASRQAGASPGVHSCARDTPWHVVQRAGADFLCADLLGAAPPDEVLGDYWERGAPILAGCIPPSAPEVFDGKAASRPVREAASRLGFTDRYGTISLTPSCGLAGVDPAHVMRTYAACRAGQRVLRDDREDDERT